MSSASNRLESEVRSSIENLVAEAEAALKDQQANADGDASIAPSIARADLDQYVKDLDLAISEEALIVLRAQFLRFSSVFDTNQSRDVVREAISDVMRPLLQRWLNEQMPLIAREVITEAISQIAEMRVDPNED
jgi:cell pole-organizing protein PopZ